jgi:hypothetical protein
VGVEASSALTLKAARSGPGRGVAWEPADRKPRQPTWFSLLNDRFRPRPVIGVRHAIISNVPDSAHTDAADPANPQWPTRRPRTVEPSVPIGVSASARPGQWLEPFAGGRGQLASACRPSYRRW